MQDNIFTVKDLSFAYGKQKVLDDLALTLHEGTITTLIGANGCGKSTLFNDQKLKTGFRRNLPSR